ncbi:MAG: molybdopterin-dependent oxidoreductase [Gemmatimonadota bacterium]
MTLSRRDAIRISGTALAGLSLSAVGATKLAPARAQSIRAPLADELVEMPLTPRAHLPLNSDGSAPEYSPLDAGGITEPLMWRYTQGQTPQIEFDYRRMEVEVDPGGMARLGGTLTFDDLEPLPEVSQTTLLQCGVPNPRGIVTWTGVRFRDFAEMIGLQPHAHYCRVVGSDRYYVDEDVETMLHPQVMLAWLMNGDPIPAEHGAPLRLLVPFRYGARSVKAITEIYFGSPGLRGQPLPEG